MIKSYYELCPRYGKKEGEGEMIIVEVNEYHSDDTPVIRCVVVPTKIKTKEESK